MKPRATAFIAGLAALYVVTGLPATSLAQDYPSKPVRFIISYPPGGLVDVLARAITAELGKLWTVPLLVENKPGGTGAVATESVFRSPADGYTILHTDNGIWFTNEFLRKQKLPYDMNKDFVPVIGLVVSYSVLNTRNTLPVNNTKELIEYLKKNPKTSYSSYGVASLNHVATEAFLRQAGVTSTHVPYQGGAPAIRAMIGDEVDFGFNGTNALPAVQEGKIKAIGVASEKRWVPMPNVPTIAESAFPFNVRSWFVLAVPTATPPAVVAKIRDDVAKVTGTEEFRKKYLEPNRWEPFQLSGNALRDFISADRKEFETRIAPLGLQIE